MIVLGIYIICSPDMETYRFTALYLLQNGPTDAILHYVLRALFKCVLEFSFYLFITEVFVTLPVSNKVGVLNLQDPWIKNAGFLIYPESLPTSKLSPDPAKDIHLGVSEFNYFILGSPIIFYSESL